MTRPDLGGLCEGDVLTRRYRLVERIGAGGMSVIWRAFDQSLQRMVAVKVLDVPLDAPPGDRELIRREARATARLIHPDTIEIYDYGETVTAGGRLAAYVVMRLLEGQPLAELIDQGPLPWAEAARIAGRVATVLAAAHDRGVVHRDVTAENVLLTPDGAKLLDFGIAAFVGESDGDRVAAYGTPPYVAPERLAGVTADPAVDVYALGVLLFEMITGTTPYPERTWAEIEAARRDGPPPRPVAPGLPATVAELCRRCLSPDPAQRPPAQEVADGLARATGGGRTAPRAARGAVSALAIALVAWTGVIAWTQATGEQRQHALGMAPLPAVTRPAEAPAERPAPAASHAAVDEPVERTGGADPVGSPTPSAALPRKTRTPGVDPPAQPSRRPQAVPRGTEQPRKGTTSAGPSAPAAPPPSPTVEALQPTRSTIDDAVARFNTLLFNGLANGQVRRDVALDLRQLVENLAWSSSTPSHDVENVRRKLADRQREQALASALRWRLDEQLDVIATAVRRSVRTA